MLLACGGSADPTPGVIDTCVTEHPPSQPFDLGDTESTGAMPAPVPGGEPIIPPPLTAATIAEQCRASGGSGCDERAFISRAAADCIARETDLAPGLVPWTTSLAYYDNHQRVCWSIMTVRENTRDGYWGDFLVLDATTGEELSRNSYSATGD